MIGIPSPIFVAPLNHSPDPLDSRSHRQRLGRLNKVRLWLAPQSVVCWLNTGGGGVRVAFAEVWWDYWYVDSFPLRPVAFLNLHSSSLPKLLALYSSPIPRESRLWTIILCPQSLPVWPGQLHPGLYTTMDSLELLCVPIFLRLRHSILRW